MLLLSWHATLLRLERDTLRLTHARLVPRRAIATDFVMALPPEGLAGPLAGPNGLILLPGEATGTVHLCRAGKYLRVGPEPYPDFTADAPGPWETLWLLTQDDVDRLRDLLTHAWVQLETGATLHPHDFAMLGGPLLRLADHTLDLATTRPSADPAAPDRLTFPAITLDRVPGSHATPRDIPVIRQPTDRTPEVATEAEFHATLPARYTLPAPAELAHPPILGSLADRDFVYHRGWNGLRQASGRIHLHSQIVRERNKYVLLAHNVEGMILDEHGVSNTPDTIGTLVPNPPPWLSCEAGQTFIDHALLARAPYLPGPHAVFYKGGYHNYYHWLIDSILPLTLMAPLLPQGTTLLLPGTLAQFRATPIGKLDYIEVLTAFGFGDMPRAEIPGEICQAEELYWADRCTIAEIPATALQDARARAFNHLPPPEGPRQRIFIRRQGTRAIANPRMVERMLMRQGFTIVLMEDLTATQQIDLFRRAEMVVAAHGAGLANLLFCPPGTQVLELSPDCEYRPFFNEIAAKLGLSHAVLPCPTDDGTFNGRLTVDTSRLAGVIGLLQLRRAA
jgi:hypothetical protein